jgi:hypothetical protein
MTTEHPITPPPELVQQWINEENGVFAEHIATQAARWGADQELLACGNYLEKCAAWEQEDVTEFYNYRRPRPKPPSLKEQALTQVESFACSMETLGMDSDLIRRALESLPD